MKGSSNRDKSAHVGITPELAQVVQANQSAHADANEVDLFRTCPRAHCIHAHFDNARRIPDVAGVEAGKGNVFGEKTIGLQACLEHKVCRCGGKKALDNENGVHAEDFFFRCLWQ